MDKKDKIISLSEVKQNHTKHTNDLIDFLIKNKQNISGSVICVTLKDGTFDTRVTPHANALKTVGMLENMKVLLLRSTEIT
jgi:hypothetical protein